MSGSLRKIFFCGLDVTFFKGRALRVRQIGNGAAFTVFHSLQVMGDNPVLFVCQKTADLRLGCAKGQPQGNFSICGDADGACFAAAVDYPVGKLI